MIMHYVNYVCVIHHIYGTFFVTVRADGKYSSLEVEAVCYHDLRQLRSLIKSARKSGTRLCEICQRMGEA